MINNEIRTNKRNKYVKCIETGAIYKSTTDAAKAHNCHQTLISMNCRGSLKSAKGMHFEFVNQPDVVINANNESKPIEFKRHITVQKEATFEANGSRDNGNCKSILCITDGIPFASMSDAAEHYGIAPSQISYACKEKGRTAVGKQFCKFEDLYLYIPEINDAINKKNEYGVLIERENKRKELLNNIKECESNVRSIEAMLIEAKQALEQASIALANFDN
jgi:hypothetical protein